MTQNNNLHYVCAGNCGGVSDHYQNCEDSSCNFYKQPLHECACEDGSHTQNIPAEPQPSAA